MLKRILFMVATALVLVLPATSALAGQYEDVMTAETDRSSAGPGESVVVSGEGCPADSTVTMQFTGPPQGSVTTVTADGQGNYSGSVQIPSNAPPGQHTIEVRCGAQVLGVTITVAGAGQASGPLPQTGDDNSIPYARIGLTLVAIGGVAVLVARRRRVNAFVA